MAYPSHIERGALRRALREHPGSQTVLAGRLVNNLTLAELHKCLSQLGIDPLVVLGQLRATEAAAIDCDNLPQPAAKTEAEPVQTAPEAEADPIETEVQTIRSLIVTGGFSALDQRLRELVTEARKPAVEIRVEVPAETPGSVPAIVSRQTGKVATWRDLFGVQGVNGDRTVNLWDNAHPSVPAVNPHYVWPPETEEALSQLSRGRNVLLYGPAGVGKTDFAQQLAARTGRPFALVSCDNGTDAATLVGMTVPDPAGGVMFQDGQLTRAIRTAGCVICIDEPSVARPGALFVMQNMLQNRQLFVAETGMRVSVAAGVVFLATDNTNGTGGGARRGYTDTNRLNAAFLDRFGPRLKINYLPEPQEVDLLTRYTGCPKPLARLLVKAATVTRAAAEQQALSHGIGLRRLISWAEMLVDGIPADRAFAAAILNAAPEQDVEPLREQCLLAYDAQAVAKALGNTGPAPASDPILTNPSAAGRAAAADFAKV